MAQTDPVSMRSPDAVFIDGKALSVLVFERRRSLIGQPNGGVRSIVPRGADLSNVDLTAMTLALADLSGVRLSRACLRGADLHCADLTEADVTDADLNGANLSGARLLRTNLRDANLSGIQFDDGTRASLTDAQLGGANLDGAGETDNYLACESQIKAVAAMADAYGKAFLGQFAALAFCAVTALTTTDDKLIPNSGMAQLPLLNAQVPVGTFFHVAPALLLCIFAYVQMLHQEFRESLHRLPAILRDGTRPDAAYSPWILRERVRPTGQWSQAVRINA